MRFCLRSNRSFVGGHSFPNSQYNFVLSSTNKSVIQRNYCVLKKSDRVKFVVFAPNIVADKIREIIGNTGGGVIGNFAHCTFTTEGIGRWREMTDRKIGSYSEVVSAKEVRIETVVNAKILPELIKQLKEAHIYKEMGYDIMPLYEIESNTSN